MIALHNNLEKALDVLLQTNLYTGAEEKTKFIDAVLDGKAKGISEAQRGHIVAALILDQVPALKEMDVHAAYAIARASGRNKETILKRRKQILGEFTDAKKEMTLKSVSEFTTDYLPALAAKEAEAVVANGPTMPSLAECKSIHYGFLNPRNTNG